MSLLAPDSAPGTASLLNDLERIRLYWEERAPRETEHQRKLAMKRVLACRRLALELSSSAPRQKPGRPGALALRLSGGGTDGNTSSD